MKTIFLGIGTNEIIIILIIVLLLFGGRKIPELMRGLGKGVREFKKAQKGLDNEDDDNLKPDENKEEIENKPKDVETAD